MPVTLDFELTRRTLPCHEAEGFEKVRSVFTITLDGKPCWFEKVPDPKTGALPIEGTIFRTDCERGQKGDVFNPRTPSTEARVADVRKSVARNMTKHLLRVMRAAEEKDAVVAGEAISLPCVPGHIEDNNKRKWFAGKLLRDLVYKHVKEAMPVEVKAAPKGKG
jgi:hypothetical protein